MGKKALVLSGGGSVGAFAGGVIQYLIQDQNKEYDLYINPQFDLTKWIVEEGYPEESFQYYRLYPEEIAEQSSVGSDEGGVMGDLKFTTAQDYIYPGSDPQE